MLANSVALHICESTTPKLRTIRLYRFAAVSQDLPIITEDSVPGEVGAIVAEASAEEGDINTAGGNLDTKPVGEESGGTATGSNDKPTDEGTKNNGQANAGSKQADPQPENKLSEPANDGGAEGKQAGSDGTSPELPKRTDPVPETPHPPDFSIEAIPNGTRIKVCFNPDRPEWYGGLAGAASERGQTFGFDDGEVRFISFEKMEELKRDQLFLPFEDGAEYRLFANAKVKASS
eukprot:2673765-Pleurochrysis_carterae.AAC.1